MITCFFENKHKAFLRHVTVDAIIVKDKKILLVKRGEKLINPGKFALPGGFLDCDETSSKAILREVLEETGYQAKIISLFRINDNPKRKGEDRQNIDFVFLVKPINKISEPDKEIKKAVWFKLDNLPNIKDFAFDHWETINLYLKYRKEKFVLPLY